MKIGGAVLGLNYKASLLALLIFAVHVADAADDPAFKTLVPMQKFIGQCMIGKTVKIANKSCVNGWPKAKYPQWESAHAPDPAKLALPTRIRSEHELKIIDLDPIIRMVQVETPDGKFWVSAEGLECDEKNVSKYVMPVEKNALPTLLGDDCPKFTELPVPPEHTNTLWKTSSSSIRGAIAQKAHDFALKTQKNVMHDNRLIAEAFYSKDSFADDAARFQALVEAKNTLIKQAERAQKIYGPNCDMLPAGKQFEISVERGERLCRTLRDAAAMAGTAIDEKNKSRTLEMTRYDVDDMLLGKQPSNHQLSIRTILATALKLESKENRGKSTVLSKLKFARMSPDFMSIEMGQGRQPGPEVLELHNGYLFAATGKPGEPIECAGFALNYVLGMQRTADPAFGKGSIPSVHDFETIHRYLSKESFETGYFEPYINCFSVVDLRKDQRPMRGDFVSTHGHIAIVDEYNEETREVFTIEAASGKMGTVGRGRRPLYEPSCIGDKPYESTDWNTRPLRGDIRVLRFDPKPGCKVPPNALESFSKSDG